MLAFVAWPNAEAVARLRLEESPSPDSMMAAMNGSIDLFDSDGRYLTSLLHEGAFPEMGMPDAVGGDGKIYTVVMDPFPHVRRYRLEIEGR